MEHQLYINKTISFVQETLQDAEGGHDWSHIERVWKNTKAILKHEPLANPLVTELAALLHDIADSKFHNGDEEIGPRMADTFLSETLNMNSEIKNHVILIVRNMSFSKSLEKTEAGHFSSLELKIVQDADRLDAIGAIGIARAFNFGGFMNRPLYDPKVPVNTYLDKETYKKRDSPTINHFHEKLLKLKDTMYTPTAQRIAASRHEYMVNFLDQFLKEWDARDLET